MINELQENSKVNFDALIRNITIKKTKTDKDYLSCTLTDSTGSIECKMWSVPSNVEEMHGKVVRVFGDVSSYNDVLQIVAKTISVVTDADVLSFCCKSDKDTEKFWNDMLMILDSVENIWCKKLLQVFLQNEKFVSDFKSHSAAVKVHHATVGGLVEHTYSVVTMCDMISHVHTWINRDLLITSAFLHDIGKLKEISDFPENEMTDFGQLVGHVVGGAMWVNGVCERLPDFPKDIRLKIIHCILAHHGQLDFGSPKVPALPEAYILAQMDNTDAKLRIFEDHRADCNWKEYNRYLGSYIASGEFKL